MRRLFNVNGSFGSGAGFLEGTPRDWAEQLAELTLTTGMSTYILAASSADDIRRFAEEVAPAVRELVGRRARGGARAPARDGGRAPPPPPRRSPSRRPRTTAGG